MEIKPTIGITPNQKKIILQLLDHYIPNTKVWIYGSRVKGTARKNSDLDMVAFSNKKQNLQIDHLREAFDESDLPFRVDLFNWDDVPEQFHQNIEDDYVVLQDQSNFNRLVEKTEARRNET
jgi:type I restriction enzyme S subunit